MEKINFKEEISFNFKFVIWNLKYINFFYVNLNVFYNVFIIFILYIFFDRFF